MEFFGKTLAGRLAALALVLLVGQSGLGPRTLDCRAGSADSHSWGAEQGRYASSPQYGASSLYSYQAQGAHPRGVTVPAEQGDSVAPAGEAEQASEEPVDALHPHTQRTRDGRVFGAAREDKRYRLAAHRAAEREERMFSSTRLDYRRTRYVAF